jgi:hypothetical protein
MDAIAPPIAVRFHPTIDAYERATGRRWFTLGATAEGEIHLLPPAVLRDRGLLDRTLRHELVHTIADTLLTGRPAWVREGAAVHFADGTSGPAMKSPCPQDEELLRPLSAGALGDAYARARACFERQLAGGRQWREVR